MVLTGTLIIGVLMVIGATLGGALINKKHPEEGMLLMSVGISSGITIMAICVVSMAVL